MPQLRHAQKLGCIWLVGCFALVAMATSNAFDAAPVPRAPLPGAFSGPELRQGAWSIHLAPTENLERIDVATLDRATRTIDMAAYVLTDWPVIEALQRAARRGVHVRLLLDRRQLTRNGDTDKLRALRAEPGVASRVKRSRVPMHLKAYQVDGAVLRVGAANFSASGLKQQDNDLELIESRPAATRFAAMFDGLFEAGANE